MILMCGSLCVHSLEVVYLLMDLCYLVDQCIDLVNNGYKCYVRKKREPTMSSLYGTVDGYWMSKTVGSSSSRQKMIYRVEF